MFLKNLQKVSTIEYGINILYCVSICSYTYQCGLKYTGSNLQTLQDKAMTLFTKTLYTKE